MEKNYSSTDNSPAFDLSLPHFDEDATLLSARPVVPLHEVDSRRRVILGLTILAAILVGAISATLLLRSSGQSPERAAETEGSQPSVLPSGAAGGSTSESAEVRVPLAREPVEEPLAREVPSDRDLSTKKRSTAPILRNTVKRARAGGPDRERDEDFDDREFRRDERRNARRERRQRRDRREQRADDLLRIREIFEGPARP